VVNVTTTYVGIAGASNDPGNRFHYGNAGIVSGGGVLYPNSDVALDTIADGASNQLMVSEMSNVVIDTNGTRNDWRASLPHSAWMGYDTLLTPAGQNIGDNRAFNTTTIRYSLNQSTGWSPEGASDCNNGSGVCWNSGANIPLSSLHSDGVNALFADGSVRFLNNSIPLAILQALATRDDGLSVDY